MHKKLSEEDIELFRHEVGHVKPLRHNQAAVKPKKAAPLPSQRWRDEARVREEMLGGDLDHAEIETGDELSYLRPGLQRGLLRKLRGGHYAVHSELDLHGLTVPEARRLLNEFLHDCTTRGVRCVRIIHGKGHHSHNRQPVLKSKLNLWLRHCNRILAFCSARPVDGGTGALYVLLAAPR